MIIVHHLNPISHISIQNLHHIYLLMSLLTQILVYLSPLHHASQILMLSYLMPHVLQTSIMVSYPLYLLLTSASSSPHSQINIPHEYNPRNSCHSYQKNHEKIYSLSQVTHHYPIITIDITLYILYILIMFPFLIISFQVFYLFSLDSISLILYLITLMITYFLYYIILLITHYSLIQSQITHNSHQNISPFSIYISTLITILLNFIHFFIEFPLIF